MKVPSLDDIRQTKVSIIVPIYNVEPYLAQCLESILSQTHMNLQCILVDDCSTDNSLVIAQQFAFLDQRVELLCHDKNLGLGPARNTGMARANGSFVFFVDSDDYLIDPNAIMDLLQVSLATQCDIVTARAVRVDDVGLISAWDANLERYSNVSADVTYSAHQAFHAIQCMPENGYLPMRAWGYLIRRDLLVAANISFPRGPHEDIGFMSVLVSQSSATTYLSAEHIAYRFRKDSITASRFSVEQTIGVLDVWTHYESLLTRFDLGCYRSLAAINTLSQCVWRIQKTGIQKDKAVLIFDMLSTILASVRLDLRYSQWTFDRISEFAKLLQQCAVIDAALVSALLRRLPSSTYCAYVLATAVSTRGRLGRRVFDHYFRQASFNPHTCALTVRTANDKAVEILALVSPQVQKLYQIPDMLTDTCRSMYFYYASRYLGRGTIVDAGCFIGGTTLYLLQGLEHNFLYQQRVIKRHHPIQVYDLFRCDDGYITEFLNNMHGNQKYRSGESFLCEFERALDGYESQISVYEGDIGVIGYTVDSPIEILAIDCCKTLATCDAVIRHFFPKLCHFGVILHQDFIHEYHPYIHISMMLLRRYVTLEAEAPFGGTVSFRVHRNMTIQSINSVFGDGESWYYDEARNLSLLRDLSNLLVSRENKWIIALVCAVYCKHMGNANAVNYWVNHAQDVYPEFRVSDTLTVYLGM